MRLFIAIQLSDAIRASLRDTQEQLIRRGVRGNFTSPENLHLTLAFIGEYSSPDDVLDAMSGVHFMPFPLALEGFGCFRNLWWAGLSHSAELDMLTRRLRHTLSDANIPFDRKRASPHITLIRKAVYDGRGKFPAVSIGPAGMTVDRISLMRSDRGKHGMIYTELGWTEAEKTSIEHAMDSDSFI